VCPFLLVAGFDGNLYGIAEEEREIARMGRDKSVRRDDSHRHERVSAWSARASGRPVDTIDMRCLVVIPGRTRRTRLHAKVRCLSGAAV
jgi:hypothetical protein